MSDVKLASSLAELILGALDNPNSPPHQAAFEQLDAVTSKDTVLGEMSIPARWLHNLSFELAEKAEQAHKEYLRAQKYSTAETDARLKSDQLTHRLGVISELKKGLIGEQFFGHEFLILKQDWKVVTGSPSEYIITDGIMKDENVQRLLSEFIRRQTRN